MRPPPITGASLPKRALNANATCPAGTIGTAAGAITRGVFSGHSACGVSTPPEPNASPRVAGVGAISPVEGVAENNEFCPGVCADAVWDASNGNMSANAGHSRTQTAIAGAWLMARSFSAQIAAISSQQAGLSPRKPYARRNRSYWMRMILSENRFPLFGIMRHEVVMPDALQLLKTRRSVKPMELTGPGPSPT